MPTYRGKSLKQDQAKAVAAVVLVHAGLAAVLVSGFHVDTVQRAVERLRTITITKFPPPPVRQPPPTPDSSAPKDEAAPANIESQPTPIVAPEPRIPLPVEQPIVTSEVPGAEGLDRTAGAASVHGAGTGAGGQGSGLGGGAGDGSGYTPAQRIAKIPDREYRRIVATSGMRRGRIGITLLVNIDGSASNCRIARSTGNQTVDQLFCQLAVQHVRFRPARNPRGQPVASEVTWYPDWTPN